MKGAEEKCFYHWKLMKNTVQVVECKINLLPPPHSTIYFLTGEE
jgi:hypothetical protein